MKKEIMNLLNSANDTIKINNICHLTRWQKDGLGYDVDTLKIQFEAINGFDFIYCENIIARDYEGILAEIKLHTIAFSEKMAEQLINNLAAGYRTGAK